MNGTHVTQSGLRIGGYGHSLLQWSFACGKMDQHFREQQRAEKQEEPQLELSEGSGLEDLEDEEERESKKR